MAVEVRVPQSGESITEVQIGAWRKSEGDEIELDEILVEIETDKAAMDLPAPAGGILKEILKKEGDEAAPGDVIALIEENGKGPSASKGQKQKDKEKSPPDGELSAKDSSKDGKKAIEKPESDAPEEEKPKAAAEARVMPSARRALARKGLAAEDVKGTGPGGRILKEDVERRAPKTEAVEEAPDEEPDTHAAEAGRAVSDELAADEGREEETVAMSPMRRVIAKNLVAAQQNAALLTTFNEADMSAVIALRKQHQEAFQAKHGVKLGFMSFFVKASIEALKLVPQVNAEIRERNIVYKNYYDIGVAVGGGRGLVVPVLRGAERMSFAEIEKGIADFARRAQDNGLELSELKGGTFTISNGGIYGSMLSTPIVNAPQSGILGLHAIQDRPVARGGQVVIRPMMYLALTYDHRLVDGREAVTFLKHIKELIEEPIRMLVEI